MKSLLTVCISILLGGCASSYVSFQNIEKPKKQYHKIFVITIFNEINVKTLNEETYDKYFRDNINDLKSMDSRRLLENVLRNEISNPRTPITSSKDKFKINIDINYNDFISTLRKSDTEAILLINETDYYYEVSERISKCGEIKKSESPKAVFQAYLIDINSMQPFWVSKIYSSGTQWDDAGTIYRSMSRRLNKQLIKEKILLPPLLIRK